mmetsp:Transcript_50815/g.121881  ORF Transcript_50815/g.121881 Transcript_50815/m.121881 type:complete len:265 (-) Transcript_50815:140-934(-)
MLGPVLLRHGLDIAVEEPARLVQQILNLVCCSICNAVRQPAAQHTKLPRVHGARCAKLLKRRPLHLLGVDAVRGAHLGKRCLAWRRRSCVLGAVLLCLTLLPSGHTLLSRTRHAGHLAGGCCRGAADGVGRGLGCLLPRLALSRLRPLALAGRRCERCCCHRASGRRHAPPHLLLPHLTSVQRPARSACCVWRGGGRECRRLGAVLLALAPTLLSGECRPLSLLRLLERYDAVLAVHLGMRALHRSLKVEGALVLAKLDHGIRT